jgi:hypothetical protein
VTDRTLSFTAIGKDARTKTYAYFNYTGATMKTAAMFSTAIAMLAIAAAARAQDSGAAQLCVDAYVAANLQGRQVETRVNNDVSYFKPIELRSKQPAVKIVVTDKASGRQLAAATCADRGVITVLPAE